MGNQPSEGVEKVIKKESSQDRYYTKVVLGCSEEKDPSFRCESTHELIRVLDMINYGQVYQDQSGRFFVPRDLVISCMDKETNKRLARVVLTNEKYFEPHSDLALHESLDSLCAKKYSAILGDEPWIENIKKDDE